MIQSFDFHALPLTAPDETDESNETRFRREVERAFRFGDAALQGINNSLSILDAALGGVIAGGPYLPLSGGTLTGQLYLSGVDNAVLVIPMAAGEGTVNLRNNTFGGATGNLRFRLGGSGGGDNTLFISSGDAAYIGFTPATRTISTDAGGPLSISGPLNLKDPAVSPALTLDLGGFTYIANISTINPSDALLQTIRIGRSSPTGNINVYLMNPGTTNVRVQLKSEGTGSVIAGVGAFATSLDCGPLTVTGPVAIATNMGISLGTGTATTATDVSRHIALYSTTYGFSVTGSRFNYITHATAAHAFYTGTTIPLLIAADGITTTQPINAGTHIFGDGGLYAMGSIVAGAFTSSSSDPNAKATVSAGAVTIRRVGTGSQTYMSFVHNQAVTPATVGTITSSGTTTAYNTTSDENLKNFTGLLDQQRAIDILRADPPREFDWKDGSGHGVGWGAQTSYAISPDLASPPPEWEPDEEQYPGVRSAPQVGEPGYVPWGMDMSKRVPYLAAALLATLDRTDALEAEGRHRTVSSRRYKLDIHDVRRADLDTIAVLRSLRLRGWTWGGELPESDERIGRPGIGLVAEEVHPNLPEAVTYVWSRDDTGETVLDGLDPMALISVLADVLQRVLDRLERLELDALRD